MQLDCLIFVLNIMCIDFVSHISGTTLPKLIYDVCPFSDICNRTVSQNSDNGSGSSCGCDQDCGLRLDCCFDHLDQYKLVEKKMVACISPDIRHKYRENKNSTEKGYLMVQACGINHLGSSEADIAIKYCRLKDENGSSLIAPVSSHDTDLIYVNEECAACNGVNMALMKHWNYFIEPKYLPSESTVIENHNKFVIPPAGQNWLHKHCNSEITLIENCLTNAEWYFSCHNLRAKVRRSINLSDNVTKNALCLLCSGLHVSNTGCPDKLDLIQRNAFPTSLTMLIDSLIIEDSKLFARSSVTDVPKATFSCPAQHMEAIENICLPINCPEGMLRTRNGCKYFALEWYAKEFMMQIKLIPMNSTTLSVDKVNEMWIRMYPYPLLWLEVPCRQVGLSYAEVYYSAENVTKQTIRGHATTDYIASFVVRISKLIDKKTSVDPSVIVPLFQKCVSENWIVKYGNKTYKFGAYFDKYFDYVQDGQQQLTTVPGGKEEDVARPALYTRLGQSYRQNGVALKKPFFCHHVRIPSYDVDVRFGEIMIISKNLVLGTNEYIVNTGRNTTFSVCIDDYDPNYTETSGSIKYRCSIFEISTSVFLICFLLRKADIMQVYVC